MRRCFIDPISELELAVNYLGSAANALLKGSPDLASELIKHVDIPEIVVYARDGWRCGFYRTKFFYRRELKKNFVNVFPTKSHWVAKSETKRSQIP